MAAVYDGFEIRFIDKYKGYGMFACRDFKTGEVILEEEPLVSCQFAWNATYKYIACDHCMRPLEDAQENARRLTNNPNIVLKYMECCSTNKQAHCECENCKTKYCSIECRSEAWDKYHSTLCGLSKPLEELTEIWKNMHYPPETFSVMLLARIIATVIQAPNQQEALSLFVQMCHRAKNEAQELAHNLLGEHFAEQKEILKQLLCQILYADSVQDWFTEEGFDSLLAMVGMNGQGIGTSPFSKWVNNVSCLSLSNEESKEINRFIDDTYETMHDVVGHFLNTEGSGLYRQQSKINHDCNPNVKTAFPHGNHKLSVIAERNISAGEEICVFYINSYYLEQRRYYRNKKLRENYLFSCKCTRCMSEENDIEKTSSEEEEEEDDEIDSEED